MILAQYTIRSKQNYIFKTNRVLETVQSSGRLFAEIPEDRHGFQH